MKLSHPDAVAFPEEHNAPSLELYLNQLLKDFDYEKLWNNKALLRFVDSSPSAMSKMSEIYVTLMQKQVSFVFACEAP